MTIAAAWTLIKTFGPWIVLAIVVTGVGLLVVDRNNLAKLNAQHVACLASVQGKAGSQPVGTACEPAIAAAATTATQANACDALLTTMLNGPGPVGVPAVCSPAIQKLAAVVATQAATIDNQAQALSQDQATTDAAVARASARATQAAQRSANDQAVIAAAPHDAAGDVVLNADGLRKLAGQQ